MSKEKLTPVEWLLNELDERDMIDKTIYHEKDRTFDSISEQALNMEKEYASQSKWISVEERPKESAYYVVCFKDSKYTYPAYYEKETDSFRSIQDTIFEPYMWQPLPPPPSETTKH